MTKNNTVTQKFEYSSEGQIWVKSKKGNTYPCEPGEDLDVGADEINGAGDVWVEVDFDNPNPVVVDVLEDPQWNKERSMEGSSGDREWDYGDSGRFPSRSSKDKVTIYTAGAMDWGSSKRGESTWRASVKPENDKVEFLHPSGTEVEHGGQHLGGVVSDDLMMIRDSDGVLCYFKRESQIGTMVELFEAFRRNRPVLVVFDRNITLNAEGRKDVKPEKVDEGVSMRGNCPEYWFLLNYLAGDSGVRGGCIPVDVPRWEGRSYHKNLSVWFATEDNISEVVDQWVSEVW